MNKTVLSSQKLQISFTDCDFLSVYIAVIILIIVFEQFVMLTFVDSCTQHVPEMGPVETMYIFCCG